MTKAAVSTLHTAFVASGEDDRTALSKRALKRAFLDNLFYMRGKFPALATPNDYYQALAYTVRDRMLQRWVSTAAAYTEQASRTVAYLSAEFLLGPHLCSNLVNLGILEDVEDAVGELGLDFNEIVAQEPEPGLGNGGLGRLAACLMDSLATLQIPAIGYGIRYEYGIFQQTLADGWQVENADHWLHHGYPWDIRRAEWAVEVMLGGHTEHYNDVDDRLRVRWVPSKTVIGVPFDTPILGYRVNNANTLRLWRAEATEAFDISVFNRGDYVGAVNRKITSENLTKVLYPNDETAQGKELRLEQQYFFVACSLRDMFRILKGQGVPIERLPEKFVAQLNDTHPAIGIAELMRILVDDHLMGWNDAWSITTRTFAYTNHTLLPEALERWPVELLRKVLPRHLEIIYEINERFLNEVRIHSLGNAARIARMSLIDDQSAERCVRMAHLACVGSQAINGVAELHSQLLRENLLHDFSTMWPRKFTNVTNGVTPRRWIVVSNPRLARLITQSIGPDWVTELTRLEQLAEHAGDAAFIQAWRAVKHANKRELATHIQRATGIVVDPASLFDVQVKRIHEYKRQHLAMLYVIALYRRLKSDPQTQLVPRTFIFGGKAAPGYQMAKLMIKLVTSVGEVINHDPDVHGRLKIVFMPNFSVTTGQTIYPAADLSEQISLAGKEASGTGNMKFAMNGALTIGTMDGANIELREAVGPDNFFLFGMTAAQVAQLQSAGYRPADYCAPGTELDGVLDLLTNGFFSRGDNTLFQPLVERLRGSDPFMLLADYEAYAACQERVGRAYAEDPQGWVRSSIMNVARSGIFSSDRTVREYADKIWRVKQVPVTRLL